MSPSMQIIFIESHISLTHFVTLVPRNFQRIRKYIFLPPPKKTPPNNKQTNKQKNRTAEITDVYNNYVQEKNILL